MRAKCKGITYKEVEKMLEKKTTNISDHYSTQKKISKDEKNL